MMRRRVNFGFVLGAWLACVSQGAFSQTAHKPAAGPKEAPQDEQLYRNVAFGFHYSIPYGWVERTKEMREQAAQTQSAAGDANSSAAGAKRPSKSGSEVLLAVFERPPQAMGESVNSAVVIASESTAAYPGLKKAEDYLGPLTELAASKGFKANGEPSGLTIDGREFVRADFTKALTDRVTMYQSTLAMVAKGQIVSFTFIAGSEDEVDELIERIGFAGHGR